MPPPQDSMGEKETLKQDIQGLHDMIEGCFCSALAHQLRAKIAIHRKHASM